MDSDLPTSQSSKKGEFNLQAGEGQSLESVKAEVVLSGLIGNSAASASFSSRTFGEVDLDETLKALHEQIAAVDNGSMRGPESLLVAQMYALNSMFSELSRRAALNMGEFPRTAELYLRLALKAQSQCRATAETISLIKNPQTIFAKQANIAQGHQQVNNSVTAKGIK